MQREPRILISNDDGINAPGLKVLEDIAQTLSDDVWIVAPETEQSGASHSLTLHDPLRLREVGDRTFAIRGTPTDCVMMAVKHIMSGKPPDLILSGVNRGANLAEDVTYSGTIAAAMEGTVLGIPSIALSQAYGYDGRVNVKWTCVEHHAPHILTQLMETGWPKDVLININFPDLVPSAVKGVEITVQGQRDQSKVRTDARVDARGSDYFWVGFKRQLGDPAPGSQTSLSGPAFPLPIPLPLLLISGHLQARETIDSWRTP